MTRSQFFLAFVFSLLFFIIGLKTISDYGINWDEPVHYLRGQALLHYFLTGYKDYADLPKLAIHYDVNDSVELPNDIAYDDDTRFRRSIYQFDRNGEQFTFRYWEKQIGSHPPLNGLLASLTNYIFYQKLGIVADIESYHLFPLLMSALLVFVVFFITTRWYGVFAGIVASLSLALYPIFWSESHLNIKDPVEAVFYALALLSFFFAVVSKRWQWVLASAIAAAFALGTKFNILFAPLTMLGWFCIYLLKSKKQNRVFSFSFLLSFALYIILPLGLLVAIWPSLWGNPAKGFVDVLKFYQDIGYGHVYQPAKFLTLFGINVYPVQAVVYATPLCILFLSLFGIYYALRYGLKEKNNRSLFVLLWFLVPVARVSFPGAGIYAGVRQIMEYIPALSILAAIGAKWLVNWLISCLVNWIKMKKTTITLVAQGFIILLFLPITAKLISIHPNENVYFNPLIGGLKGAYQQNFPDWGVTLGTVYWQGVEWLNVHAEEGARLVLVKGLMANIPRIQLRRDIRFGETYWSGGKKDGEYIMEVIDYYWLRDIPKEKRDYLDSLEPVYQVRVEDVPILTIWKNDVQDTKTTLR